MPPLVRLPPAAQTELNLNFGLLDPGSGRLIAQAGFRPGVLRSLRVVSTDSSVIEVTDSAPKIEGLTRIKLKTIRPGRLQLLLSAPAGVKVLQDRVDAQVIEYQFSGVEFDPAGAFLSTGFIASNPRSQVTPVRVLSASGTPLRFGTQQSGANGPTSSSLTVELQPWERKTLFLEPVASGGFAEVLLTAPETEPLKRSLFLGDPWLTFNTPGPLTVQQGSGTLTVVIQAGLERFSTRPPVLGTSAGTLRLTLQSSNPAVVRAPQAPVELAPGQSRVLVPVQLVGKGEAILSFDAPQGFNGLAKTRNLLIQVR